MGSESLNPPRPRSKPLPFARGNVASFDGETAMKSNELNSARRLITKVLANPGMDSGQRDRLRRAKRELDKIAQSGKLDRARIFRVTETIAATLLEVVEADNAVR